MYGVMIDGFCFLIGEWPTADHMRLADVVVDLADRRYIKNRYGSTSAVVTDSVLDLFQPRAVVVDSNQIF